MTGDEYKKALAKVGLNQSQFGQLMGASKVSGRRWARYGIAGPIAIIVMLLDEGWITVTELHELSARDQNVLTAMATPRIRRPIRQVRRKKR